MDYRPVDRDQVFLLPPAMADWLPDDHVVWFVIEVVKRLDTTAFHAQAKLGGVGRQGYDPDMLVTLFVYAMAQQVRSSRRMERLCWTDVAFRIITAGDVPDHTVLCRFRQTHEQALGDLLTQSLLLAAELGFVRFGTVAIDGTKIAANASKDQNRTEVGLRTLAEQHLAETAATDRAEDEVFGEGNRGDQVPDKLKDRTRRGRRIGEALEVVQQRKAADQKAAADERAAGEAYVAAVRSGTASAGQRPRGADPVAAAQARYERERERQHAARVEWDAKAAAGQRPPGRRPKPAQEHWAVQCAERAWRKAHDAAARDTEPPAEPAPANEPKANVTDPESRLQKTRNGWLQGYNAQTGVTDDQFIAHADPVQTSSDTDQYQPVVDSLTDIAAQLAAHTGSNYDIGTVLADAGYDSNTNLTSTGPDRLIANTNRRTINERATNNPAAGDPPADATARERMDHRLRTPDGHTLYKRRSPIAETPNAWLKDLRGLRQFSRRGLNAARSELRFASAVTNLLHLRNLGINTTQLANR